jgi:ABC-2 type transport system ATP-binding protein
VFSASHLTKRYGQVAALEDLSIEVPAGRIGLVGANGAGKTTLFRLLLGLSRPTSGTIEIDGRRVDADPVGIRARVGYMPEHDCLPSDQTAADLVAGLGELSGLQARDARQRASDVLNLVGLDEARFRPMGTFSTGMKQRVKLAQALVADPMLVLLDEPTAGLDPTGREEMLALVSRLGEFGISAVMATHLLDDVQKVCDHVVMLDGGRLVVAGPTEGLLATATGTVLVEVDGTADALIATLEQHGMACTHEDGRIEVAVADLGDDALDVIRDAVADLGLALTRLSTRVTSLDDVFVGKAAPRVGRHQ